MKRLGKGLLVMSAVAIISAPTLAPAADEARLERIRQLLDSSRTSVRLGNAKHTLNRDRRAGKRVTVVVEMSGDSVASAKARVEDHQITSEQKTAIRQAAAREQASVEPSIAAHGGRVLKRFSHAINGVKIDIDESQVESLRSAPGVVAVRKVRTYRKHNVRGVPFVGAPLAWQGSPQFRGEGQKIAIIDSGIDYTHANFGGPGTVEAYEAANATDTGPANPLWFGPKAPKVKGGIDLVGDAYNADSDDPAENTPKPDPNPLDCDGHGSHVAGTAAGFGVAANGSTYKGPYTASAIKPEDFIIGPGVAPKADIYAIRVFGCDGSTSVVVDAIEWAVENDVDVINLSLGSDYGTADDADAIAVDRAAKAGILVATSSGNSGPIPYITGAPGTADSAISTASVDANPTFVAANITFNNGSVTAINANVAQLPSGPLQVAVLRTPGGAVSLGCDEAEYAGVAGKLVVTLRGTCDRVFRAQAGQRNGAAAVIMVNNAETYPPFEGPIEGVTIPFFGVPQSDGELVAAATEATSFTATSLANPGFRRASDFSSGGPRFGDSVLKPNVTAPGTSVFSTGNGTGNQGVYISGTSMSSPHTAGVAALTSQAHPKWNERSKRAAIVQSSSPTALLDYAPGLQGAGLIQALGATRTKAVAFAEGKGGGSSISFGFEEFTRDFRAERDVTVRNLGDTPITFRVTSTPRGGSPHTLRLSTSMLTVGPRRDAKFEVTLRVPVETVGATHDEELNPLFPEVAGYVSLTPVSSSMNGGVTLTLPYYLVPRARSNVAAVLAGKLDPKQTKAQTRVLLGNILGGISGSADFYTLGLHSPRRQGVTTYDTRAVGVQSLDVGLPNDRILVFAINTFDRFSSPELALFDFFVDVNDDGVPDFELAAADEGLLTGQGFFTGVFALAIFDLKTDEGFIASTADAPTDGSTVLLPLLASWIGATPGNPRFSYTMTAVNLIDGTEATMPGRGKFNAFTPSITTAETFTVIDRNKAAVVPVTVNPSEWKKTPALGLMVVSIDNKSGDDQAILLPAK